MVSFLPYDFKNKHKEKWHFIKFIFIFLILTGFVYYFKFTNQYNLPKQSFQTRYLFENSTDNETSHDEEHGCMVQNITYELRCEYIQNHTEDCNKYLSLMYCQLSYAQPIWYILMVFYNS
jgi:hypothetical protein